MVNIFGIAKNSFMVAWHLAEGNAQEAVVCVAKAGFSCIPVIGHIPGASNFVGQAITGQTEYLSLKDEIELNNQLHNQLDFNHDGVVDQHDASDMFHHVVDFLSHY